jgi:hypothetical protein
MYVVLSFHPGFYPAAIFDSYVHQDIRHQSEPHPNSSSLHSVIIVLLDDGDRCIAIYHAFFQDYLATRTDMLPAHDENAKPCFELMNRELRVGISGVVTSHLSIHNNNSTTNNLRHFLSLPSQHVCTAWGDLVLPRSLGPDDLLAEDVLKLSCAANSRIGWKRLVPCAMFPMQHACCIDYAVFNA